MNKQTFHIPLLLGMLLFCAITLAQNRISGTVGDATGPLPGVSITIKGTSQGTETDFDGKYTISNVKPTDELIFSFIGMAPQTVKVGNQQTINITLEESAESLDEIVVVGYGTQKKTLVTGASVNVKGEDIAALNTGSTMEALQGVTPGISITRNSGQPGAGTRVTIRGLGTIGNSNPLYVVDGIVVGNIDYLSPSDIQSIDVLKDAASSAIYGARAANGVVLVTTVSGRKNSAPKISYDTYFGVQNIYKKMDVLNAQEFMQIMDEGRFMDGLAPYDWQSILTNNSWLETNYPGLGVQLGEDIWQRLQNGWQGTNWVDEIETKNATIQNHAVNITGGSEDMTYSAGISYFEQEGILGGDIIDAGYKRLTARLNTKMVLKKNDLYDIITIGENFTYSNSENRSTANGNIYWNDLHDAIVQSPLMPAYWQPSIDNNISEFGYTPSLEGWSGMANPIATMHYRNKYNYGKGNNIVGNIFVEIQPLKGLKFKSIYGVDAFFGHSRSLNPTYNLAELYRVGVNGVTQRQYFGNSQTFTNTISYDTKLEDHNLNALIGMEYRKPQVNVFIEGRKNNLIFGNDPLYAYINNTDNVNATSDIHVEAADWAATGGGILSYMGRLQYDYKEKYLFTATMRYDGSSNFAEGNRWGFFPSASAGWIITNEDFIDTSNVLNFAKLRASWGQNGNESIDNFLYSSNIAYNQVGEPGYYFGDTKPNSSSVAFPERVSNPNIKWETSEQLNFGFDTRFFNSRLNATFDWYKKTTKDWLVEAPALGTSGALPPWINGGDIENTGVELALGWNDTVGNDFKYDVTLSGAYNKNKVTRIANADGVINGNPNVLAEGTLAVSRVEVGKPIGFFYGYETAGILQNQDEVDAYTYTNSDGDEIPYFSDQRPGDVRFVDQNNDGVIDEKDKKMLGDPNPDVELGFNLNLQYKSFYLNTTLTGKFGMQVMQSYRSFTNFTQNYTTDVFNRWHGEGTSNRLPRLTSTSGRNESYISDIYMHNADYVRISNLTFGYDFSKIIENVDAFSTFKAYVAVNNLYTFTSYNGLDPEVRYGASNDGNTDWASGIDLGLYPSARTVMFGFNFGF